MMKLVLQLLFTLIAVLLLAIYQAEGQFNPITGCDTKGFCVCAGHAAGDVVPDCTDCTRYYLCGVNTIDRILCPAGQVFDINVLACVPGSCPRIDGECPAPEPAPGPSPCPSPSPSPSPTPSPSPSPSPGPSPSPSPCPGLCPSPSPAPSHCENQEVSCQFPGQIIPNAEHCRLFWTCVELCPVLGFCELGMWFDRDNFVCNYQCYVHNCPAGRD
ncbi:putative uncharacterized protein DDB_G0290521 [Drosophila sulfurigaster albostrigata]|uniref:putative uncharacterized protein DDB_G0290521 n=1 Tax=Drosophila sulfurigaster albostrigata TaxID=89887 RepID=UPI002D21D0D8|nr:putative uncharacterized protein DDB_G0290521 [Drosophila sulfurigaster albostrigata]